MTCKYRYCSGLTSVIIPNSVTTIGSYAFYGCSITSVTIPNSVTAIGSYAFANCSITSVTIPNSVTSIGAGTFSGCIGLTSVTIPNSVTSIGEKAFQSCRGLKDVTIPNSVFSIGDWAFRDCSGLTSVTIPNSVMFIGEWAFRDCSSLTEVYCYAEDVPTTGSDVFYNVNVSDATLYVPRASIDAYKATEPWSGFGTIKTLSGEIPVTPKCATPTISYVGGKLQFTCETEGVEFVYDVKCDDAVKGTGANVSLTKKYIVTVYATKSGYDNSDVATKEINVGGSSDKKGDVNGDGEVGMPDVMFIVNYILNGKFPEE